MNGRLYELLPAAVRARDSEQGWPLRALLAVAEGEYDLIDRDLLRLYDDWFIETCAEWVLPYIGDLLGVRGLLPADGGGAFSQRALVANTLSFRRAKGTAAVLERYARAVTGWPAAAVEFFQRLATTQYMNHVRPGLGGTLSVRGLDQLDRLGGPFGPAAHTAEVRRIEPGHGRYNLPNVGVYLWRLQAYPVQRSDARLVPRAPADPPGAWYTFNPLGLDAPLFNRPHADSTSTARTTEADVPALIRPLSSLADLTAYQEKYAAVAAVNRPANSAYYGPDRSYLVVDGAPVSPFDVACMNLSAWAAPPAGKLVGVDGVRGRLSLPAAPPGGVQVSYAYGFSGDLGGGPYSRADSAAAWLAEDFPAGANWQVGVTRDAVAVAASNGRLVGTLAAAITRWNAQAGPGSAGVIAIMDSRTDALGAALPQVAVPGFAALAIVAADWPEEDDPNLPGGKRRVVGRFAPLDRRPHIGNGISVCGTGATNTDGGRFVLDGLLIEGSVSVADGHLGRLRLAHCTVVPPAGAVSVAGVNALLQVVIERSITGPLALPGGAWRLSVADSVIDAGGAGAAINAPASAADVRECTVFGTTAVGTLNASNSIFANRLTVARRQTGCTRFCYLPPGSLAPRRFRCQPADPASAARVVPSFTSTGYGHPGYAQLAADAPPEIDAGADDEGQMGAFHFLRQSQRVRNLKAGLSDYLRVGVEAGLFFVT